MTDILPSATLTWLSFYFSIARSLSRFLSLSLSLSLSLRSSSSSSSTCTRTTITCSKSCQEREREFFIDNLLVRIHYVIVMIK